MLPAELRQEPAGLHATCGPHDARLCMLVILRVHSACMWAQAACAQSAFPQLGTAAGAQPGCLYVTESVAALQSATHCSQGSAQPASLKRSVSALSRPAAQGS